MVKVLTCLSCVLMLATVVVASDPPRKIIESNSYPTTWEADMASLDLLSNELQSEPHAMSIIFVYGSNSDLASNVQRRIRCFTNYLTHRRSIPSNRIRVLSGGYREQSMIELWVVPAGADAPTATPTIGRKNILLKKRGAKYRCEI